MRKPQIMQSFEQSLASDRSAKVQYSKKFLFWLDEPQDWNKRVRRLRLAGWCVAKDGRVLKRIQARLGGQTYEAPIDRTRPEVPGFAGIPEAPILCGFLLHVEVPRGKSRLELQVNDGQDKWQKIYARNVSGPFFASNDEQARWRETEEAEARERFQFWFDRPADWMKPAARLYISGWCLDRAGDWINGIRARIGRRNILGNYGIPRQDIVPIYPHLPLAGKSGFAIAVDVPPGKSTLTLALQRADGFWQQFFHHEIIGADRAKQESLPAAEARHYTPQLERSRFQFWFDRPKDWSRKIRDLHISGWCVATEGKEISEMRGRVGNKIFPANYGIVRPDVAVAYETRSGALRSGFSLDVVVPRSSSKLVLEVRSADGPWERFSTQRVRGPLFFRDRDDLYETAGDYPTWIRRYDRLRRRDRYDIARDVASFSRQPLISVVLPVYNPEARWLRRAIKSVRKQLYPRWELCVVDDASTVPHVWSLLERYARRDDRIKIKRRAVNGHICAASNDAIEMATGEYVAFLDHDDELAPAALYFVARALNDEPRLRLLYGDEDKVDSRGNRSDPYFKPDWNPDLFRSQNYISHLSVYSTALVRDVGGLRVGLEGSQDYDLTLRCIERIDAADIGHIPHILYHWRIAEQSTATFAGAKPYAHDAAIRAMQEHLDRSGIEASVEPYYANYLRVRYPQPRGSPLVSLIIPTRDRVAFLRKCVESILSKTDYPNFEIIVIDNESREAATAEFLKSLRANERVKLRVFDGQFNFSRLNNIGVMHARGEYVVLLNNDLEVKYADWLSEMVSHAARPEVGAVGARLWYPDGTMQHGGVILGVGGIGSHAHAGVRNEHGYFARAHLTQNFSAVTAACMLVRKDLYEQLGGLDETNLPVAFNDVDFCLRLSKAGYRIVWTPHAELYHHESASRGLEDTRAKQKRFLAEVDFMRNRWAREIETDPCYNPNLSIEDNKLFTLAFPPRTKKPWKRR